MKGEKKFNNKEYMKEYNKKNRERINAYAREYKKKHPEKIKEQKKRYYEKNREQILRKQRKKQRKHRKENRNKIRVYAVEWGKKNRDKRSQYSRKYQKKMHGGVIEMLGGKCVICGITDKRVLQMHHKDGGGYKEFKRVGAYKLYRMILQGERSTEDLEVRCSNCNLIHAYERRELKFVNSLS